MNESMNNGTYTYASPMRQFDKIVKLGKLLWKTTHSQANLTLLNIQKTFKETAHLRANKTLFKLSANMAEKVMKNLNSVHPSSGGCFSQKVLDRFLLCSCRGCFQQKDIALKRLT